MQFLDDSPHPENQDKVVITVAPYGPEWMPADFPEDSPVTMDEHVQKAVDCYNADATVLHMHVRELDGACITLESPMKNVLPINTIANRIGVQYDDVDETLAQLGMVPNRRPGQVSVPLRAA
ncbi:hypothetical protein CUJ89_09395 [Burkholderia pyrrocinia]|uniref:3-keto-5-aminohexanoate cleavage protein n=1 Tax=Burkholderia pyrrocinia TaxID=60550 RepID=A0A2Z5MTX8_BURPY|nr:hypothetical protein CUJ89_09395 [Burkholderia pyrrocinia]